MPVTDRASRLTDVDAHRLRILHLPDVVGGHPSALSFGERHLGAASQTLSYGRSPYGYSADWTLSRIDSGRVARWAERFATFVRIRNRFDVFHFNFGKSLLSPASDFLCLPDLPFYGRRAAKVMTFQGSDARTGYEHTLQESLEAERELGRVKSLERWSAENLAIERTENLRRIERVARYCDWILALNPDLLAATPPEKSSFFPYAIDPAFVTDVPQVDTPPGGALHVVHLSTNRVVKGTGLIERELQRCSDLGVDLTYEIVEGRPRPEALAALARADIVIDQMVLGWYGAAAVEACLLGKPVITWISDNQAARAPGDLVAHLPFLNSHHSDLARVLAELSKDRERIAEAARAARQFAVEWHDPVKVARQALARYSQLLGEKRK